jgi:transmembrane protein 17
MTNNSAQVWIILILFAFIMMVIFELIRLYLGYLGNLSERVPELTGFWLLTLIVETPLSLFLLIIVCVPIDENGFQIIYQIPIQFALQLIHFIFIFFENIFGLLALRVLARYQIARFHYKQFDGYRDLNDRASASDMDWLYNLEKANDLNMKTQDFQARRN